MTLISFMKYAGVCGLSTLLIACSATAGKTVVDQDIDTTVSANTSNSSANVSNNAFVTDVAGIKEAYLSSSFWLANTSNISNQVKNGQDIRRFNQQGINNVAQLVDVANYSMEVSADKLKTKITGISKPYWTSLFYQNGTSVDQVAYKAYKKAINLSNVVDSNAVQFAIVVTRTSMRRYPTKDVVYKTKNHSDLDRFQETGLFPGDVLAVLHESKDGKWVFAQSYNYAAWLPKQDIAFTDRGTLQTYVNENEYLVVTGDKVLTAYNPHEAQVSELQLDMGVKLPLASAADVEHNLYGQNPYTSYVVKLPTRNSDGNLVFRYALIARNKDVHKGFLSYTKANVLKQSFKFLGERYGWGHSYNGRDCTGFVGDVYKSLGILMPRNSGEQGNGEFGINTRFSKETDTATKMVAINNLDVGDLIYIPGHVMMFIGNVNSEPYVIHDVSGMSYFKPDGSYYRATLSGVSVTPLLLMQWNKTTTYIDKIYAIKKIR